MKKRHIVLIIVILAVILCPFCSRIVATINAEKATNNANAVLPQNEGLPVVKPTETEISIGLGYVTIVKKNGELWVWGIEADPSINGEKSQNTQSAWRLAEHVAAAVPVSRRITDAQRGFYLGVLYEDSSLWIWDISRTKDDSGEICLSFKNGTPEKIMEGVSTIIAQGHTILALKTNASLWSIRKKTEFDKPSLQNNSFIYTEVMKNIHAFWVNPVDNPQTYLLRENGELFGCGENGQGQLGVGFSTGNAKRAYQKLTKISDSVVSVITQNSWSEIFMHTMAIKDDHSLWLWGQDIWFDSTSATNKDAREGFFISNVPVRIMENVAYSSISANHSLVIQLDGSLWVWGCNNEGQLGTGNYENIKEPVNIMNNIISVSAGNHNSFALQADGGLWAWGGNSFGQLGIGDTENRIEPTRIMEKVSSISSIGTCSVAVKQDGSIWIWGSTSLYPSFYDTDKVGSILKPICIME